MNFLPNAVYKNPQLQSAKGCQSEFLALQKLRRLLAVQFGVLPICFYV